MCPVRFYWGKQDSVGPHELRTALRHPVMPVANRLGSGFVRDQWRPVGIEGRPSYALANGPTRACRRSRRLPAPYGAPLSPSIGHFEWVRVVRQPEGEENSEVENI